MGPCINLFTKLTVITRNQCMLTSQIYSKRPEANRFKLAPFPSRMAFLPLPENYSVFPSGRKKFKNIHTCSVIWNFFLEHKTTAWSISWGLTWALKFFGFQSFLMEIIKHKYSTTKQVLNYLRLVLKKIYCIKVSEHFVNLSSM